MLKEIHCIIKYFLRIFLFYKWNMHIPHTSLYVYAINITKTRQNTKYYKVLPKIYILQRVDYQSHFPVKKIACKWFQLSKLIYIYYFMLSSRQAVLQPQTVPCESVSAVFWQPCTSLQGNQPGPCEWQSIKDQCSLLSTNSSPPHHIPPWGSVPLSVLTQTLLATSFFFFSLPEGSQVFSLCSKVPCLG